MTTGTKENCGDRLESSQPVMFRSVTQYMVVGSGKVKEKKRVCRSVNGVLIFTLEKLDPVRL